jgi:hypothetical protein
MNYLLTEFEMRNLNDPTELLVETIAEDNYLFLFVEHPLDNMFVVVVVVVVVLDNNLFELVMDNVHLYRLENIRIKNRLS